MKQATYARARLWTGISGVGTFVVLATIGLVAGLPERLLGGQGGSPGQDAAALFLTLAVAALVALPFDLMGGYVLPRRHGRPAPDAARFAVRWFRGVLVLLAISTASGTLILTAGRAGGRPVALATFVAILAVMLLGQERIARLVGGLRRVQSSREGAGDGRDLIVLEGEDPGFSGGFTGPSATPVVPARWARTFEPASLDLLLERRRAILDSGAWRAAILFAIVWNTAGFGLASLLPGAGVTTVAGLVSTALGFTLWTFVGLLVLPTPSRSATRAADVAVAVDDAARARLEEAVRTLDQLQDDEPERSPGLESVFHPVPSVSSRIRALASGEGRSAGAWHLARTALYLSHAGLSLLPRAVHCNAGRPELWVYLPSDG